jgi:hypothetical protein
LTKHVRVALDLYGQNIHLTDFHLPKKFRGQGAIVHYQARPFPYFYETLKRLQLKFPADMNLDEPADQKNDQEFDVAIDR